MEAEQQEHQAKLKRRQAQRDAGKKSRGKDPEPPQEGPRDSDQVSLTDEDSRIMPVSGGGFEQSYNAQAAVDTETMLVIVPHVSQSPNNKREVLPVLDELSALPQSLGQVKAMLADTMSMRGLDKAQGEWALVTLAWNVKRLHVLRAA